MYNKLFTKILDSSIWLEDQPTRLVWITFIAMMDQDGIVALSSIGNVANRARVSIDEADAAIHCLEHPDAFNPDQDHEGRRIERIPGMGWTVLNAAKYRDIVKAETARAQNRERVRKHRAKDDKEEGNADVMNGNEIVMPSDHHQNQNQIQGWIDNAISKFKDHDRRIIEIAVIETALKRPDNAGPIKSVNYFLPEIERLSAPGNVGAATLDVVLKQRRKQAGLI